MPARTGIVGSCLLRDPIDDRHFLLRRQAQHPNEPPLATQKFPQDRRFTVIAPPPASAAIKVSVSAAVNCCGD